MLSSSPSSSSSCVKVLGIIVFVLAAFAVFTSYNSKEELNYFRVQHEKLKGTVETMHRSMQDLNNRNADLDYLVAEKTSKGDDAVKESKAGNESKKDIVNSSEEDSRDNRNRNNDNDERNKLSIPTFVKPPTIRELVESVYRYDRYKSCKEKKAYAFVCISILFANIPLTYFV